MVKCKNCGYNNEQAKRPMICPDCGHIAMPFVKVKKTKPQKVKEEKVEEQVLVEELVELVELKD